MANEYRTKVRAQQSDFPAAAQKKTPGHTDPLAHDSHTWLKASLPDESPCLLTGVTFVEHNIVVCDNENKTVKIFRIDGKFIEELFLQDPCGICSMPNSTDVAITEPEIKQITICSLEAAIVITFSLRTEKKYQCITTLDDKFVVGCSDIASPCIDVIDSNGTILQSLQNGSNQEKLFRNPTSVACLKSGDFLISDPGTCSVVCINKDGSVKFRLGTQGRPSAVCVGNKGTMYMAHYDSNEVYRITSAGSVDLTTVDKRFDLKSPLAMCISDDVLVLTEETPSDRILVVKVL